MTSKASKKKNQQRGVVAHARSVEISRGWLAAIATSALLWFVATAATSSRLHFVMVYRVLSSGPPLLEPFLASFPSWGFASLAMALWCGLAVALLRDARSPIDWATIGWAMGALVIASTPLSLAMLLRMYVVDLPASYWEPLWLSAWSGVSFAWLVQGCAARSSRVFKARSVQSLGDFGYRIVGRWDLVAIIAATCLAAIGWAEQSSNYYNNFLLGFNDFGHFAQRLANTASGQGLLLESPVLPMFWDHFNPGLLLLVPLWMLFPNVHLFFVLQSVALASGALFVWGIARQQGLGRLPALLFGLAWLAQPVLGQMNLAYTYGWHPISLAIPLLLAAIWSLTAHRPWFALVLAVLAMSMEEGVIVIVCLFCGVIAVTNMGPLRIKSGSEPELTAPFGVSAGVWLLLAATWAVIFVMVYRLSGLAEFQTARFATLGSSTGEVLLSPILRPGAFWGSLFGWQKLYFVLSLWIPCFVPCLLRGWRPLLATALPLLVLLVWDHRPATSLAFQYASTLLPLFWLATIQGTQAYAAQEKRIPATASTSGATGTSVEYYQADGDLAESGRRHSRACGAAAGALATGLILSVFVGQLAYSSPTLLDVIAVSYGNMDGPHQKRLASEADGQWLTEQVRNIRLDGSAVLATGRIAAHVVGNSDVETAGQYLLRRAQLAELPDRLGQPIAHYRWIILDRREGFQQTSGQIAAVEAEALQAGFRVIADEFDVVVMRKPLDSQ